MFPLSVGAVVENTAQFVLAASPIILVAAIVALALRK